MSYSTITGILRLPKYYKVEKQMTEEGHGASEGIRTGRGSGYTG